MKVGDDSGGELRRSLFACRVVDGQVAIGHFRVTLSLGFKTSLGEEADPKSWNGRRAEKPL